MILKVLNDNGLINNYEIKKELFFDEKYKNKISYIASSKKETNALNIFKSYFSNAKSILFDSTNKSILKELENLNIKEFNEDYNNKNIFNNEDFSFLYFTSGSTGFPLGALKTKENIISEIEVLTSLLKKYEIKRVIVTVPFIHFYGSLMGLFYPLFNNIDIVLKEHFLPNDLLDIIEDNSLVVTTPLYIKSLNRISSSKNLSNSIFISSTAPLQKDDAKEFNEKFSSNILQIFGSTETGGIAYKYNDETLWTPLERVNLSLNEENELKVESDFISNIIFEKELKQTNQQIQTFDYVEFIDNKFKLIGRSSQILKIAGKRYSTIQIENILEQIDGIEKAVVFVNTKKDTLKDEILDITIESKKEFLNKDIKKILQEELSNIKFSINLKIVDKIKTSSVGKKLAIQ
ncbi:AMP-binding protein [Arcobacter aquimarinus]|uniref:Acyl-CoA synthetase / AMP-(Fatty) acid ligase n=1 Tax=Arcobacter aquimarinus TaxID=1315211 RepID=A0AAE7B354_9BACT|nr:class I adenylate-forming enzyme family protein [Arcobacter aquimarinus]QKE24977.1 acyl-CoA synthetase / AMP-(fatty) acid ligase [Arcobacter aquimarinus]RXI36781.1 aconitate hydratase [Arcobacter aquimarinus]